MGEPAQKLTYTFAEYLALEAESPIKHEYLDGEIFDLAGGTPTRSELCANVISELHVRLRGRSCRVYSSDLRIRVLATGLGTYPDASVVCDPLEVDPADKNTVVNPAVLVKVLLDATRAYDRGEKFNHYRHIPSLRDCLLVSQREALIEHYTRNDDDSWTLRDVRPPEVVRLSIGCEISVAAIYAGWQEPPAA